MRFESAIVGFVGGDDVLHFEPSAWFKGARRRVSITLVSHDAVLNGLESFSNVGVVVFEAACHDTAEDEVKWLCPSPILFEIIHFKGTVNGDPKLPSLPSWKSEQKTYMLG